MKKIALFTLVALMSMSLLISCGGSKDEPAGSQEKQPLEKVVVSEFRGIAWSSAYVAKQLGYFEDEGLDVEFAIYKDGPIAFQGMHAGDSDFCMLSAEPVMRAYDEGLESYFILTNTQNRTYGFASNAEFKDVKSLKGKTVFAGMPGSAPYSFVLSILKDAGLGENDVSFVNMEYGASIMALAEKKLDASFFDTYNTAQLLESVPDVNILLDATISEVHKKLYGSEYCETTIVTCTKKFAAEKPEIVQKFTNASVKGLQWMNSHTSGELAELVLPLFEGMTKEELAAKYESLRSSFSKTGEIHAEGYQTVEDFCLEQGLIKKPIGYENIVASQFVENALKN